ncbi:MAG: ferredoxin--NADP reductase [Rickettsiales bacterium]|jgi:ferredoxin--NADP+ reductase|nr:ferredoxin--NADP reductase [Rickettsiales bacterium]
MNYNAVIKSIKEITPDIRLFRIKLENGAKLEYTAGQFAVLGLPDDAGNLDGEWHRRAYSITSAPSADEVEFYIVLVEDGRLTSRLFALSEGAKIFMGEKVAGLMSLDGLPDDRDVLFVCTGTGIAPFISMLREHGGTLLNGKRQVALVQGSRHTYELGFSGELTELMKSNPNFHYFQVVSRAESETGTNWTGRTGHVQTLLKDGTIEKTLGRGFDPASLSVFLCGNPKMVDEVVDIFKDKGFTPKTPTSDGNLYFDKH